MRPTMEQIRSLGDFGVSNLWDITITEFPTGVTGLTSDDVNFRAVNIDAPPKRTGASQEVTIRGHKVKQPGDYDYSGTITVTLVATADNRTDNFIRLWREKCIETNTGKQEKKLDVEAGILLTRYDRQHVPYWQYEFRGFLEDYDPGGLTETGEILQPTLTISFDYFKDRPL